MFMAEKSLINYAYDVLKESKEPLTFKQLFDSVLERSGLTEKDIDVKRSMSQLYTQLTFDGRFALGDNNTWDLGERHTYNETHKPINEINDDEDLQNDDAEEQELLEEELGLSNDNNEDKDDSNESNKDSDDEEF